MNDLDEVRQSFPEFKDLSDEDLAYGLKQIYFNEMPDEEYYAQLGMQSPGAPMQQQAEAPISNLGSDILGGVAQVPGKYLEHLSSILKLPQELSGAIESTPGRFAKNLAAGTAKLGRGIANLPPNVLEYLGFPNAFPGAPEFDINEVLGLSEQQPGDALIQGLTENLPTLAASTIGALPMAGAAGLQAIGRGENPITSGLTSLADRFTGTAASKAASKAPTVVKALSNKKMAQNVSKAKSNAIKQSSKEFKDVINEAKEKGATTVQLPKLATKKLYENLTKKEAASLKKAIENPTVKKVHKAQSDLGKIERRLDKAHEQGNLLSPQIDALNQATRAKDKLLKALNETFEKAGGKPLVEKYSKARENYATKTIPYKENKNISKYEKNKLEAKNLVRKLANDDAFMLGVGKQNHPEIPISETMSSILNKAGLGAKMGIGLEAAKLLKGTE